MALLPAEPFLGPIRKVLVTKVMLSNGGPYPLEKEALDPMVETIATYVAQGAAQ